MKKIRLDDTEVLVGLEWTPLPLDVPERKGMRDFLAMEQNKGVQRGIILRARGVSVVGTPTIHLESTTASVGDNEETHASGQASSPKGKGGFLGALAKLGPTPKSAAGKSAAGGRATSGGKSQVVKAPSGVPSACALLALANQRAMKSNGTLTTGSSTAEDLRWIVAQQIIGQTTPEGEDLFWMGVVMNGVPLPDGDMVAGRQKVVDEILEILANTANFVVHTTDKDIRYEVMSQVDVVDRTFHDIVLGIPLKEAELTLFSLNTYLIAGITILVVVLGLGWWGYSSWSSARALEAARAQQLAQAKAHAADVGKASQQYTADVRTAVSKGLDEAMAGITQAMDVPSPRTVLDAWIKLVYAVDLDQSGWRMTEIDCALDGTQPVCTINLERNTYGVNRILLQDHPDAVINADKATYIVRAPEAAPRSSPLTTLVSPMDFQMGLLSDIELLRGLDIQHLASASTDISKSVTLPPKPSILPTKVAAAGQPSATPLSSITIQTGVAQGDLKISGNQLWMLAGLGPILDQPSIAPKTLVLTINDDVSKVGWELSTSYLLRTKPQPVIPAIPIDETSRVVVPVPEKYRLDPSAPVNVSTGTNSATAPPAPASSASTSISAAPAPSPVHP